MTKLKAVMTISSWALAFASTNAVSSEAFPSKTVRLVCAEVGGASDTVARLLGPKLSETWNQSVVIENRTQLIYSGQVVNSASPDGHTVLISGTTFWTGPLFQKMPFDPVKDFTAVTLVSNSPVLIVVLPSFAPATVADLIALAKAKPGELNFGTATNGSAGHLAAELLKSMAKINITRVQYKGAAPSMQGVLNGDVHMSFVSAPSGMPLVKGGKLRALAVTSAKPSRVAPGVPTVASYGLPGYEVENSVGIFVTPKTPKPIVNQLNRDIVRVILSPDTTEKLLNIGTEPVGNSPEQFAASIRAEIIRIGKVVKDAGIGLGSTPASN